jgi:hypothetical protein
MNRKNVILVLAILLMVVVTTAPAVPTASARRSNHHRSRSWRWTPPTPEPTPTESPSEPAPEPAPPQPDPSPAAQSSPAIGLSGYIGRDGTQAIDAIIQTMDAQHLTVFRMSFNPEWLEGPHPYQASYIQYFLDHCEYTLIVDRNHLYPPTEASASTARQHWNTVQQSLFEILARWPNHPRVMVELINEYVSSDYNTRMQGLIDAIRAAGYTNGIVVNKWTTAWHKFDDPLDNTYQGYHFYFNSWSVAGATQQMEYALARGIKVLNTEVGADFNEYRSFTTSTVSELTAFLRWCADRGIGNAVWMYEDLSNWNRYQQLGLQIPT